jgi:hypothetical protein
MGIRKAGRVFNGIGYLSGPYSNLFPRLKNNRSDFKACIASGKKYTI